MRTGKFDIKKDKKGEFRFALKAPNGRVIAISEGYKSFKGCLNGVYSVMDNADCARIFVEGKEYKEDY